MSRSQAITVNDDSSKDLTQLVSREPEWKLFKTEINLRRRAQQVAGSIINFVGTGGIGKSILLRSILQERLLRDYQTIPWAMVDFDDDLVGQRYLHSDEGPVTVLEDWVTNLAKQTPVSVSDFSEALDVFYSFLRRRGSTRPKRAELEASTRLINIHRDRVAEAFLSYVQEILEEPANRPLVLFLDTVEDAPKALMTWLEKAVLGPVTGLGWVVCVLASRQEVDWQFFDVRKRVHFWRLRPFDENQTATQLSPSYSYLAPSIIKLSFGLPAATEILAEEIREIELTEEQLADGSFFKQYLERLVRGQLLEQLLYGYILDRVSEELREALFVISPLRYFTVNVAAHILPRFASSYAQVTSGIETLAIIREMMQTTLVDWDREKRGYTLEEPLRRIMALVFMVQEPQRFLAVHQEATELYAQLIELKNQESRRDNIIEWIYHQALISHSQGKEQVVQSLQRGLRHYLEKFYVEEGMPDISAIDALYNQLQSDKELQEELQSIAEGAFDELLTIIKAHHNRGTNALKMNTKRYSVRAKI